MSDIGDDDDDYGSDDGYGWIYVEDHYDEVDDLVERTCPSPVLHQAPDLVEDYDPYAYFEDINYLSDPYYDDYNKTVRPAISGSKKRKRRTSAGGGRATKIAKTAAKGKGASSELGQIKELEMLSPVCWLGQAEREREDSRFLSRKSERALRRFRLLPHWQQLDEKAQKHAQEIHGSTLNDEKIMTHAAGQDQEAEAGDISTDQLQHVASLLEGDALDDLKKQLAEKGIVGDVLDMVLQDLIEGRERQFDDDDDDEDKDDNENSNENKGEGDGMEAETLRGAGHAKDKVDQEPDPKDVVPSKSRKSQVAVRGAAPKTGTRVAAKPKQDPSSSSVAKRAKATPVKENTPPSQPGRQKRPRTAEQEDVQEQSDSQGKRPRSGTSTRGKAASKDASGSKRVTRSRQA